VHGANGRRPAGPAIRRRDRHGRGLRGSLAPPDVPLHRTRAERFDDLVLQAVSQLEPRWAGELSQVEFAVEEIPPPEFPGDEDEPVPLARLEEGPARPAAPGRAARPARIVLYRRPLQARAEGDDELAELVLDVVVEQFARMLGVDPEAVDPGYPAEE
jgi:predicted Zn-dependent protease with MMP-like domain